MKILAIDTATEVGAIGLSENGKPVAEISFATREAHSSRLLPAVNSLLVVNQWTLEEIDGFGVSLGPGSFTGLRVGLATIKGLALALEKPVVGLNSLEALAHPLCPSPANIVSLIGSQRGRVYVEVFRSGNRYLETVQPLEEVALGQLLDRSGEKLIWIGPGVLKYREEIAERGKNKTWSLTSNYHSPRGFAVAELAHREFERNQRLDLFSAQPVYVKPLEAERALRERTA